MSVAGADSRSWTAVARLLYLRRHRRPALPGTTIYRRGQQRRSRLCSLLRPVISCSHAQESACSHSGTAAMSRPPAHPPDFIICLAAHTQSNFPRKQDWSMQELVAALHKGTPSGKHAAAVLLWQLLTVPASANMDPAMAGMCMSCEGLVPGLSWALHASSWAAAGLIQALTHDNHRWVCALAPSLLSQACMAPFTSVILCPVATGCCVSVSGCGGAG